MISSKIAPCILYGMAISGIAVLGTGCGASSASKSSEDIPALTLPNGPTLPTLTGRNVLPLTVNGNLCSNGSYVNKPCVAVTICTPGTQTCQTINDILLDSGSFGLRIFKQAITSVTPTQVTVGSNSLAECVTFGDGSTDWGPIQSVDVVLGTEAAVTVPIHVIDQTFFSGHYSCGTSPDTSPSQAGFNGILGVGVFSEDCGPGCASNANNGLYYGCTGTTCTKSTASLSKQAKNPVAALSQDQNGVILMLPSISTGGAASVNGYLVLGIGTYTNNVPTGVTAYPVDPNYGQYSTTLNGTTYDAIVDSGSNHLAIPPFGSIADCTSTNPGYAGWLCTSKTQTLSATTIGYGGTPSTTVPFQIGSAIPLFDTGNSVFLELGANGGGQVIWGLPFFIGRNVYFGFEGTSSSLGSGTYWAY